MSDDDVRFVIAHELAHVVQFARNDRRGESELERDADAHALKWLGLSRRPRRTAKLRELMKAELLAEMRRDVGMV